LLCGILLPVVILQSCSDNRAVRLRYEAEKKLHQAEKFLVDSRIKPELVDPQTMKAVAAKFGEVVEFCYQALDSINANSYPVEHREIQHIAFGSSSRLSQLFFSHRQYDTCVTILNRLMEKAQLDDPQLMTTYVNLGQALQASGLWDSALTVYNYALERYYPPVDDSGEVILVLFNIPAHIFHVANMIGDSAGGADMFRKAQKYYSDLATSFPDTRLATASHANLARLYDDTGQWEKEIAELSAMLDSTSHSRLPIELKIADIYGSKINDLDRALKQYDEILEGLDNSDTLTRPKVLFRISMVEIEQGKYAKARKMLVDLKKNYPRFYATTPLAQYAVARSFELEGNWNRAEVEYNYLIENYRGSDEAMSTLIYLTDLFEKQGRQQESDRWFKEAEKHFDKLATVGMGTLVEAKALSYKADLYRQKNDWNRSAEILLSLFDKYPDSETGQRALLKASAIYRKELHNQAAADSLIEVLKATLTHVEEGGES